jgi:hypothetical protein
MPFDIVRRTPGNVFEAGTFYGKSTSVLCEGMLASGQSARRLVSYDLSTTSERQFRSLCVHWVTWRPTSWRCLRCWSTRGSVALPASDEAWKYLQHFNLDHLGKS